MFFYVIIFFVLSWALLLLSKLKINIQNMKISTEKYMNRNLNENYKIEIALLIFRKIKILSSEITKEKLDNLQLKNKLKKFNMKKINLDKIDKTKIEKLNRHKPDIKYINLIVNIGLEDATFTSYSVAIVSSILGIILRNTIRKSKNSKFIINPMYINKNLLNLELNCIIEIKMIHIIYIIYILNKKRRDDKYGRTSNRRSYDYSYE